MQSDNIKYVKFTTDDRDMVDMILNYVSDNYPTYKRLLATTDSHCEPFGIKQHYELHTNICGTPVYKLTYYVPEDLAFKLVMGFDK